MRKAYCARCNDTADFIVSAGDPATFWFRSETTCTVWLPRSKRWARFVGPVTVTPLGNPNPVMTALFQLPHQGRG